jgi:excisionase family DNA binding protein
MSLPRVLSVDEVAEYLQLSEATVRAMLRRGEIPGARLAGQWRVRESALAGLFDRQEGERAGVAEHAARVLRGVKLPRRSMNIVVPMKQTIAPDDKQR